MTASGLDELRRLLRDLATLDAPSVPLERIEADLERACPESGIDLVSTLDAELVAIDPALRATVLRILGRAGHRELAPALDPLLGHADPDVRLQAAVAACWLGRDAEGAAVLEELRTAANEGADGALPTAWIAETEDDLPPDHPARSG